jgi:hypothetical protein
MRPPGGRDPSAETNQLELEVEWSELTMERMWFTDSIAARPALDERERQPRKRRRRRALLGCAGLVVLVLVIVFGRMLLATPDTGYWLSHAQDCGAFGVYAGEVQSGYPQAAMICFMQAYAKCRAATLSEAFLGSVDVPTTFTYLVEPSSSKNGPPCSIQMNDFEGGVNYNRPSNQVWIPCTDVAQRWYGLHFYGCGRFGDLVVSVLPLGQGPPGLACGDIHERYTLIQGRPYAVPPLLIDNTARTVASCFLQAQQTCQPAWAASTRTYPDQTQPAVDPTLQDQDRLMLLVEPHRGTCSMLELEWHTQTSTPTSLFLPPTVCRSLVLQDDGLYVSHCDRGGPTGRLILPVCGGQPPMTLNVHCESVPPAGT